MGNIGSRSGHRDDSTHVARDIAGNGSAEELRPEESRTNGDDEEYTSGSYATIPVQAPEPFSSYNSLMQMTRDKEDLSHVINVSVVCGAVRVLVVGGDGHKGLRIIITIL